MRGASNGEGSSLGQGFASRKKRLIFVAIGLSFAALLVVAVGIVRPWLVSNSGNPESEILAGSTPVDTRLYIDPGMKAIAAAREDPRFDPIAQTPQAKWFGDWSATTIRDDVSKYLAGAEAANEVPVIVLYHIPHRDCGSWSSGGASDAQDYRTWVQGAADALRGHSEALVIVEPDALPDLGKCEQGDRLGMMQFAVDALSTTGARVYIDAGSEVWLSPSEIADRLARVGVDKVAGFSLNVAGFSTTRSEVRYGERVLSELSKHGITNAHFVIDIGRNGAGRPQGDDCGDPAGARLGDAPHLFQGGKLDALLWIKLPGESDGCRGIPTGEFSPPFALSLLGYS